MAEVKKIATRQSYGEALKELGALHEDIVVLDADLANATKTDIFKKAFPERHFDCGIAESNMICVAAGLSTVGYVPFASSFAMFAAGRAFEQVRKSIGSLGSDLAGIDQSDRFPHKIADHLFQQGIVGAAQDQGVDARGAHLLQVIPRSEEHTSELQSPR